VAGFTWLKELLLTFWSPFQDGLCRQARDCSYLRDIEGRSLNLVFYLLYAPVEWKISYAPWYIGMQLAIACAGGLIGGFSVTTQP